MLDSVDSQILHALQLSPRISFRRIAEAVAVPEQVVARRYRKLRQDGVVRVIGLVNPQIYGECQWLVRVRAKPDDLQRLADALIRRPEVTHANVLSGWTELVCIVRASMGTTKNNVLQRLPRTSTVLGVEVDLILRVFTVPPDAGWTGYGHTLDPGQVALIQRDGALGKPAATPSAPDEQDRLLLDALADDGRTPHARLAHLTGWTSARVKRRIDALQASATLAFDVDLLPDELGFSVNAMLWLTTQPRNIADLAKQLATHEEVASVIAVSGRNNLLAVVICRDADHLYSYLSERLAGCEQVLGYEISIRTLRLKQAASLINQGRLIHPRHSQP